MVTVNEIKKDLTRRDANELLEYCLRLARFKKENKELLAFLLFDSDNMPGFVENIKKEVEDQFGMINMSSIYFIKKSVRKILRNIHKYIRFTLSKQVEAELLIHFCNCLINYSIPIMESRQLKNLYDSQLKKIEEDLSSLHPDLQYDLRRQINKH
ncbi:MAG: hypothetical protein ABI297_00385 [Ginsengibacter sp.]